MAEQQYIYVAAPVVAAPASYAGYTGYTQQGETTYVQMPAGPTATAVQATPYGYQYETQTAYQPTQQTVLVQPGSQAEYAVSYAQQGGQTISYVQTQAGVQPTLVYGAQGQITTVQPATAAHLTTPAVGQPATATYIQHPQIGGTGQFQYAAAPPQQQTGTQPQTAQYATAVQQAQQQVYAAAAAGQPQTLTIVAQPGITYQTASGAQIQASPYGAQQPQTAAYTIQPAIGQPQIYGQQQQIYGASPQQTGLAIQGAFPAPPQLGQQPQMFLTNPGSSGMGGPQLQSQPTFQQRPQMIGAPNGPLGMNQMQYNNQQSGGPMKSQSHHQQHDRRSYGESFNGQETEMNGGGRGGGELVELHQFPDTIFIQGLPDDITEDALIQQFSSVGKLKMDTRNGKPRVMIVKDKATGRPRGEATVGFQDVTSVNMAIKLFNNKDLFGRKVRIEIASRRVTVNGQNQNQNANRGTNNRTKPDDGIDWFCPNCDNQNFSWRTECNRCKNQRPQNGLDVTVNPQMFRGPMRGRGGMEADRRMIGGPGRGMMQHSMVLPPNLNNFPRQRLLVPPGGPMPSPMRGRHMGQNRRGGRPY